MIPLDAGAGAMTSQAVSRWDLFIEASSSFDGFDVVPRGVSAGAMSSHEYTTGTRHTHTISILP